VTPASSDTPPSGEPPRRRDGYLEEAERYAGRTFSRREEIGRLLAAARGPDGGKLLDELLFLSKFCDRALGILSRTGPGGDDVAKLTSELATAAERVSSLVALLLGNARGGEPVSDRASFADLRVLIGELAVLKNFELHEAGR